MLIITRDVGAVAVVEEFEGVWMVGLDVLTHVNYKGRSLPPEDVVFGEVRVDQVALTVQADHHLVLVVANNSN
jgi:hypothetical protein